MPLMVIIFKILLVEKRVLNYFRALNVSLFNMYNESEKEKTSPSIPKYIDKHLTWMPSTQICF